jgi:hypothetical protein
MSLLSLAKIILLNVFIITALNKKPLKIELLISYAEQLSEKIKP